MNTRPGSSAHHSSPAARLANFQIASRRFCQVWASGVPAAAARDFVRPWPRWTAALALIVVCVIGLDSASVGWVRNLPAPVTTFFQSLTDFGKSGWLLVPSGAFCLVLLLSDWRAVNRRIAVAWTEVGVIAGFAFLSIAGAGIVTQIIKQLIGRGRPVEFDSDGPFSLMPFQFDYAHASFPSGHATTMGALAVVIAVLAPRVRWVAFSVCAIVASSRVFVLAHYPSDVIAGFLLGGAFTWFYALALAKAGIALARISGGTIKARAIAIRHIFLQPIFGVNSSIPFRPGGSVAAEDHTERDGDRNT